MEFWMDGLEIQNLQRATGQQRKKLDLLCESSKFLQSSKTLIHLSINPTFQI